MIVYGIDDNQNDTYKMTKKVNASNWINLKISQVSGVYEIKLDYELVYNKTNLVPKVWRNVNLETGNTNGKDNISITVHYRSFKINTCKTRGKRKK